MANCFAAGRLETSAEPYMPSVWVEGRREDSSPKQQYREYCIKIDYSPLGALLLFAAPAVAAVPPHSGVLCPPARLGNLKEIEQSG